MQYEINQKLAEINLFMEWIRQLNPHEASGLSRLTASGGVMLSGKLQYSAALQKGVCVLVFVFPYLVKPVYNHGTGCQGA